MSDLSERIAAWFRRKHPDWRTDPDRLMPPEYIYPPLEKLEVQEHLPITQGEWNTNAEGRTLSGFGVCATCDGGGCRDCIG